MNDTSQDEKRFNETLKRMLKTPPQPHDKRRQEESRESPAKKGEDTQ